MKMQSDSKKHQLGEAFIVLLRQEPLEKITINQICNQAKVHRSTFYRHFEDKFDLLRFCFQAFMLENLDSQNVIRSIVETIDGDHKLFRNVLINNLDVNLIDLMIDLLTETIIEGYHGQLRSEKLQNWLNSFLNASTDINMTARMLAGGILTVLSDWIENNYQLSPEKIIEYFANFEEIFN